MGNDGTRYRLDNQPLRASWISLPFLFQINPTTLEYIILAHPSGGVLNEAKSIEIASIPNSLFLRKIRRRRVCLESADEAQRKLFRQNVEKAHDRVAAHETEHATGLGYSPYSSQGQ